MPRRFAPRRLASAALAIVVALVLVWQARGEDAAAPPAPGPTSVERAPAPRRAEPPPTTFDTDDLPPEARTVLERIEAGGPFRYRQDGSTFGNRERRLPAKPRGYYREYTVETPGERDRGARRIVTGGDPPTDFYYTDDHYRSFRRIERP